MQTDFVSVAIQLLPLWLMLDLAPSVIGGVIASKILKMPIYQIRRPVFFEPGDMTWIMLVGPFFEELFFRGFPMIILGPPGLVVGSLVWVAAHIPSRYSLIETYPRSKKIAYLFTYVTVLLLSSVFYVTAWTFNGAVAVFYHIVHNTIAVIATKRGEKEKERKLVIEAREESENRGSLRFIKAGQRPVESVASEGETIASWMFVKPKESTGKVFESDIEMVEHVFVKRKASKEVSE
jgi:hypothetical protein